MKTQYPLKLKCTVCADVDYVYDDDQLEFSGRFGCGRCCGGVMQDVSNHAHDCNLEIFMDSRLSSNGKHVIVRTICQCACFLEMKSVQHPYLESI